MIERLLISVMLMLTWMGTAKAEGEEQTQTLTVFAPTNYDLDYSLYVPLYGYYADDYQKCEIIYPAENLNDLKGKTVSQMDFYLQTIASAEWENANFKVYLKEVSQSNFPSDSPSFIGFSENDLVYEGSLSGTASVMPVKFNKKSYTYQGGNLLVGVYQTTMGTASKTKFYGKVVSNASIHGTSFTSIDKVKPYHKNFIPETTFYYTTAEGPSAPVLLTVNDESLNSATISWTSVASAWQICIDNDEENPINVSTKNYTITDLEADHCYEVKVRAVKGDEVSDWSNTISLRTLYCSREQMVNISYVLKDSYGDGWEGSAIVVKDALTDEEIDFWTIEKKEKAFSGSLSVCLDRDIYFDFVWIPNTSTTDCSFEVYDPNGEILFEGGNKQVDPIYYTVTKGAPRPIDLSVSDISVSSASVGWNERGDATQWQLCVNNDKHHLIAVNSNPFTLTGLEDDTNYTVMIRAYIVDDNVSNWSEPISFTTAEICPKPKNLTSVPGSTDATLSWDGTLNSYVLQYNAWWKQGDDITPVMAFVPYTYDLRYFSGTGSIAIRHYNVTDKFWLHVDDIVVTNAEGTTVYSEDFENCEGSIPTSLSTIDHDGDGYGWEVKKNEGEWSPFVGGDYGISSASYKRGIGGLSPDDWLIIPDVELGGTLSFKAYGQSHDDDNFAVYVLADAYMKEVPISNSTTYHATRLVNDMLYVWRVKGVRGSDQSRWASSLFVTPYDPYAIATGIEKGLRDPVKGQKDEWFTIYGQKLSDKPTKKGVYIHNGKSVVNK